MLNTFSINNQDFEFGNRLVPSYYFYSKVIRSENEKNGIKYLKLEEIAENISDGEHSHIPRNKTEGIRYLYGRNIKEGIINFDPISDDPYISEIDYNKFKRCHIKDNDILISIYGTIGKSAIYKEAYVGKAGIPRHIANITLKEDSPVTGEFITAFFRSKYGKWQLNNITTGNIQQLLSLKNIRKLDIPIPEEKFLNSITSKEKQAIQFEIEALKLLEKAKKCFYKNVSVDFNAIENEMSSSISVQDLVKDDLWTPKNFKPLYLGINYKLGSKWKMVKISEIADVQNGDEVGSDNYIDYIEATDNDIPFIRTTDIVNFELDQYPDFFVPEEIYLGVNQNLKPGDILFAKDGKIGVTGFVTKFDKVIIASGISKLRLNEVGKQLGLTPEYLFLVLSLKETGLYPALRKTVFASTIPHLREKRLTEIEIPILSKEVVYEISELIKKAFEFKDNKKYLISAVRNEVDEYFSNL